jgi:hypothetical protein
MRVARQLVDQREAIRWLTGAGNRFVLPLYAGTSEDGHLYSIQGWKRICSSWNVSQRYIGDDSGMLMFKLEDYALKRTRRSGSGKCR